MRCWRHRGRCCAGCSAGRQRAAAPLPLRAQQAAAPPPQVQQPSRGSAAAAALHCQCTGQRAWSRGERWRRQGKFSHDLALRRGLERPWQLVLRVCGRCHDQRAFDRNARRSQEGEGSAPSWPDWCIAGPPPPRMPPRIWPFRQACVARLVSIKRSAGLCCTNCARLPSPGLVPAPAPRGSFVSTVGSSKDVFHAASRACDAPCCRRHASPACGRLSAPGACPHKTQQRAGEHMARCYALLWERLWQRRRHWRQVLPAALLAAH